MNPARRKLILDHLCGLLTMAEVNTILGVSNARGYQLRDKLFQQYRVPTAYQHNGPACAAWVAAQDYRLAYNARYAPGTPEYFYHNERWRDER